MAKKVKTVESKELGDTEMYASLGRQVEVIYNSFPKRVLHMLEDDGMDGKVVVTKGKLAELLREVFKKGVMTANFSSVGADLLSPHASHIFEELCERAIQPLVHRSSGGHDDHGREVE